MLSYRHSFHAGNDADVVKHIAWLALLGALARKDKSYFVLETHAGAGLYRLDPPAAGGIAEWQAGVARALEPAADPAAPPAVRAWHAAVRACNGGDEITCYPGSPWITANAMRTQDRAHFTELHPRDAPRLVEAIGNDGRCTVREADGYAAIRALLPPAERRGAVFIDPAYERDDEPDRLVQAVRDGLARFGHGTFVVWYPLGGKQPVDRMVERLAALPARKSFDVRYLRGQAHPRTRAGGGLAGCGLTVLNPPFRLDAELLESLQWLAPRIDPDSRVELRWLVAEAD